MITSLDNKKIKDVVKLKQKKYRDLEGKFIVETLNLIKEAYKMGVLESIYVLDGYNMGLDVDTYYVTDMVMKKITSLENSYVLGVCKKQENKGLVGDKFLLLDGVQDPGNLGTIIRTSLGFGIDTIVLSNNTVDLYNEKVIRATEGAMFSINILRCDLVDAINELKSRNITVYGTDVNNGVDVRSIGGVKCFGLVMGNEGNGVSDRVKELVDANLYIPIDKKLESLNVGVATGIILFSLIE